MQKQILADKFQINDTIIKNQKGYFIESDLLLEFPPSQISINLSQF